LSDQETGSLWRGNLAVMVVSSGIWRVGGGMTGPFWALYVLYLGGSYFHIGLISAVSAVLSLIPAFFGGYLADAFGRKRMVSALSALMAINTAIYVLAPGWEWLLVARSLDSVFAGLRQPAFSALIADSTKAETRAMSYGLWQAVPPIFGLASPYAIGVLMDRYGVLPAQRWAYVVLLVTSSAAALMRVRWLSETLPPDPREVVSLSSVFRETLGDFRKTARVVPRQLWALILIGGLFQFGASLGIVFAVTYATTDVIHLTSAEWGLINTVSTFVSLAVSVPFAISADRYGRLRLVQLSLALTPLAILGFTYSRGFYQAFASYTAMTVLGSMGGVASQALFVDYSPREHRGRIGALTAVIGSTQSFNVQMARGGAVIGAAGNMVGGVLYGGVSYASPFLLMAGIMGSAALIGLLQVKEPKKREE